MRTFLVLLAISLTVSVNAQFSRSTSPGGGGVDAYTKTQSDARYSTPAGVHDSIKNMKAGVFNVLDFGADPTGLTASTTAIRNTFAAAGDNTVIFPKGLYLVDDSILITGSPTIIGTSSSGRTGYGSTIKSNTNKPILYFYADDGAGGYGWEYGPKISNIYILGSDNAAHTLQDGIICDGTLRLRMQDLYIHKCGGNGIRIGKQFHTSEVYLSNVYCHYNHKNGVYGRGRATKQVNNIIFSDGCSMSNNHQSGFNIVGNDVVIRDYLAQGNDSAGIKLTYSDITGEDCTAQNILIEGGHSEVNGGGSVSAEMGYVSTKAHVLNKVEIRNNYFYDNSTAIKSGKATACINFLREPGSSAVFYFTDFVVGVNSYTSTNLVNIDGNSLLNYKATVYIENLPTTPHTEFTELGTANTILKGGLNAGYIVTSITAAGGITDAMLAPNIYFYGVADPGAVDISANPQFADGYDGQIITITGNSDTYTLTIDDGNGVQTNGGASIVLGAGDMVSFKYVALLGDWYQCTPVNNN